MAYSARKAELEAELTQAQQHLQQAMQAQQEYGRQILVLQGRLAELEYQNKDSNEGPDGNTDA